MTQPSTSPAAAARSQRRMWGVLALVIVLPLLGIAISYGYRYYEADRELRQVTAETDQLDPRWRLEDVEADRAVIPDERNSGFVTFEATRLMPKNWPAWEFPLQVGEPGDAKMREALGDSFSDLEPQNQLNTEQIDALRAQFTLAKDARDQARKLADMPQGRFPITYSDNFIGTLLPHAQDARGIARLLGYDVLLRAQEGDADGALTSCRALFNAGRSVGDEPLLISLLVRAAVRAIAVDRTQRVLAQGQPSDGALAQLQQLFEKDEAEPLFLNAIRGERAGLDLLMDAFQTGKEKLTDKEMKALFGLSGVSGSGATLDEEGVDMQSPGFIKSQRAAILRYMNRAVEIAKLSPQEQQAEFAKLDATAKDQPVLVRLFVPALSKVAAAQHRTQAQLRYAAAALAVERYRLKQKEWPKSWDAVVAAGYLRETPIDSYDGKPLRLKRLADGLMIYSVGPDGEDNGGKIDRRNPPAKGTDIGFQLWDPAQRRQPPAPPKLPPAEGIEMRRD